MPIVDADVRDLAGDFALDPAAISIDVRRLRLSTRSMPDHADLGAALEGRLVLPTTDVADRVSGSLSFVGAVGGVPFSARGAIAGRMVEGAIEVPRVVPSELDAHARQLADPRRREPARRGARDAAERRAARVRDPRRRDVRRARPREAPRRERRVDDRERHDRGARSRRAGRVRVGAAIEARSRRRGQRASRRRPGDGHVLGARAARDARRADDARRDARRRLHEDADRRRRARRAPGRARPTSGSRSR